MMRWAGCADVCGLCVFGGAGVEVVCLKGSAMNSRIKIVSEMEVRIRLGDIGSASIGVECGAGCLFVKHAIGISTVGWDAEGRAALRDCINCLDATDSFAALSDSSGVPYVGKRMRRILPSGCQHCKERDCEILRVTDSTLYFLDCDSEMSRHAPIEDVTLLPLVEPPAPKVRQYKTPQEACCLLGKVIQNPDGDKYTVHAVSERGVEFANEQGWESFVYLAQSPIPANHAASSSPSLKTRHPAAGAASSPAQPQQMRFEL